MKTVMEEKRILWRSGDDNISSAATGRLPEILQIVDAVRQSAIK